MGNRRVFSVLAGLMIMTFFLAGTPVLASGALPDGTALIMEHFNATDPANATLALQMLQSLERRHNHALVPARPGPADLSVFSMAAAEPGMFDAIGPGDSLQTAIDNAPDGSTIYLDPGTYPVHNITVEKNIRIQTNATNGGTRYNTILDAELQDRVFNVTGPYVFALDNITVQNGALVLTNSSVPSTGDTSVSGGGILAAPGSTLSVTSSVFRNCTVTGSDYYTVYNYANGGAIASNGTVAVTSSSFEDCAARTVGVVTGISSGGAIYTANGVVTITSSAFSRCTAFGDAVFIGSGGFRGGAVYSLNSPTTITSTTFTDSSATIISTSGGYAYAMGGAVSCEGTGASITDSAFTRCTAESRSPGGIIGQGLGGAVYSADGTSIANTTFSGCTATGGGIIIGQGIGGAVYSADGTTLTRCTFTGCTASGTGQMMGAAAAGAVEAGAGTAITGSAFNGCTATAAGGSIGGSSTAGAVLSGPGTTITNSTFNSCTVSTSGLGTSAGSAGAAALGSGSVISGSTFTSCAVSAVGEGQTAALGGALTAQAGSAIADSTFTGCSVHATGQEIPYVLGGAVLAYEGTSLTRTTFTGCSAAATAMQNATVNGGAVSILPGTDPVSVTHSTFSGCSVSASAPVTETANGGAIGVFTLGTTGTSPITVTSSTITGCSAKNGGAVSVDDGNAEIHFNRLYQNTASGTGLAINATVDVDATDNWWGDNLDPSPKVFGPVTTDPWLVLGIAAAPPSITIPQTSSIRTNLTFNSHGDNTAGGGIYVPDGIVNTFALISGPGIIAPLTSGTGNGAAQTTWITLQPGTATITGTADNQTVYLSLNAAQGTWTPPPTEVPNDDDWPQVGGGASGSGGSGGGSAATTGSSGFPLMTVTVNIGGDSKAGQAIVTGTKLSELIVTGTVQHGPFGSCNPPAGSTFQYLSLEPARYGTIANAVINFTIPQSWLDENHVAPGSVVLYHMTPDCWQPLPTTYLFTKDGTAYFSGQSSGFSQFAIAGTPAAPATPAVTTMEQPGGIMSGVVPSPAPAAAAKTEVATQTTAPPSPAQAPAKSAPFPLVPVVAVLCCAGLIGGGWYARRWWIRRQNPALFAEYD